MAHWGNAGDVFEFVDLRRRIDGLKAIHRGIKTASEG